MAVVTSELVVGALDHRICSQGELGVSVLILVATKALFSFENFLVFGSVAFSFLFDKHCPIME